jgi:hypothetical protein
MPSQTLYNAPFSPEAAPLRAAGNERGGPERSGGVTSRLRQALRDARGRGRGNHALTERCSEMCCAARLAALLS